MSTDALPRDVSPGRWWKRALLAITLVAAAAAAAALIPRTDSSLEDVNPVRTHPITRGDLIVTVTEQGTLESANNTEIKNKVRGQSTVIWVIEAGTEVEAGDELVRLDTLALEDDIAQRTKFAHLTRSGAERARADVITAELAIAEYLEGQYRASLMTLEKDLAIAQSNLRTAQNLLGHTHMLFKRGYVSELDVDDSTFAVMQATLNVDLKKTDITVLKRFDKAMQLETLQGNLNAARANFAAEDERSKQDAKRRDLALQELDYCVIKAERSGLVVYPSTEAWKNAPEIEEGASVYMDQVLLLMPDLANMHVKVGIHESLVDRIKPGMAARVTLPDNTLEGEVDSVAPITRPAGWWTGNVVKYDTELIRMIQEAGFFVQMHSHGKVGSVLDYIEQCAPDALEPLEPPPDGDIELAEVKKRIGEEITLCGNIEMRDFEIGTPEEIDAKVKRIMEDAKGEGGFILMPTATPITVPLEEHIAGNLIQFIDSGIEYGGY